ncbi:hypothetical protein B0T10DRAFT_558421 [Thelonectria olida]|uniref:Uncharacterized protein n=1 Tax=Thelonectria olida TaxID=1576542 RepID=A0A9P9ASA8_9HYPO|nr:hypothetical protein B0T10DRAFT_558421 [Thelonectria olida]
MRPCDSILIRLRSIESSRPNGPSIVFKPQGRIVHQQRASVQHICNSADHSFIRGNLLWRLLLAYCDSNSPEIDIDNDTIVVLEWHYPGVEKMEVTEHLVVEESPSDIILRVEDWEKPVQEIVRQKSPTMTSSPIFETNVIPMANTDRTGHRPASDPGYETDYDPMASSGYLSCSRRSSATTVSNGAHPELDESMQEDLSSLCNGDREREDSEDSETTLGNTRDNQDTQNGSAMDDSESFIELESEIELEGELDGEVDWGDIEISSDDPDGMQEDAYWDWSPEQRRWFHKDTDNIRWFPEDNDCIR